MKKEAILNLIDQEKKRQQTTLDFIASENIASEGVLRALGSCLTNKYAEGAVGHRYYQGNKVIDEIEKEAIERAKKLFGAQFVNVQALSGSPANFAVYSALLNPGERILGMDIRSGGHLSFGQKVSFSGKFFESHFYTVNKEAELLDYGEILPVAKEVQPKVIVAGTSAYPRDFDWAEMRRIADEVGAFLLADISHVAGLVVAGLQNNPIGLADVVMTTTHKTLRGPRGALIMTNSEELAQKIDRAVFPGMQGGPHMNVIAAIAVCLGEALQPEFKVYAEQIVKNAKALAEALLEHGFRLVSGGTDNHLVLIDLRPKGILGIDAAVRLEEAGIITNANLIPFDPNPPKNPSGLRLGTPSVTTRGLMEKEIQRVAGLINKIVENESNIPGVKEEVQNICRDFPIL